MGSEKAFPEFLCMNLKIKAAFEYTYGTLQANRILGVNQEGFQKPCGYLCDKLWSTANLRLYWVWLSRQGEYWSDLFVGFTRMYGRHKGL